MSHSNGLQQEVIAFLSTAAAYGLPGTTPVERVDTHISVVFLAGPRAYKLKRAVSFDYVDFSTAGLRHAACEAELSLNRRTAPELYLAVRSVTRAANGTLSLDGAGEPVDWIVEMLRFDQNLLLDRIAERGQLQLSTMEGVADAVARLHAVAEKQPNRGGREDMAWVIDGNALAFREPPTGDSIREVAARMADAAKRNLEHHADLLERRRQNGFTRRCHGDLHLRNICLLDGVPTIFDAVEFNDRISCVDVLYDIAFLLMDLWRRRLRGHANAVFNGYLARTLDLAGLPLLPLFLSCRAAVRAKTSAAAAKVQRETSRTRELISAMHQYLGLAEALLHPPSPMLIAVGGFSGVGKSTLARRVAPGVGPVPGAVILRSDVIRKTELRVEPGTRLTDAAYTPPVSGRVYELLCERASTALAGGHAVIADAVFGHDARRAAIQAVAREHDVPFLGIWLEAPEGLLARRLAARGPDASDATADVLKRQIQSYERPSNWNLVDASTDVESVERRLTALLESQRL